MKTVHMIRKTADPIAEEAIAYEVGLHPGEVVVLLIQDGVLNPRAFSAEVVVNREDLEARASESPYRLIDYAEIARLIAEADRTVVW